jgi:hypothetical protein
MLLVMLLLPADCSMLLLTADCLLLVSGCC